MKKFSPFLFIALLPYAVPAQAPLQFIRNDSVHVFENSQQLAMPWAGGMNFMQFSPIDLNQDGVMDLLAFDRTGNKITTYINNGTANQVDYVLAPQYVKQFPKMINWVLLRDYNCDGKMDIFTYYDGPNGGITVYKNISTVATGLQFQLVNPDLQSDYFPNSSHIHQSIYVSPVDIPCFRDIDGDGDIDVLTYANGGVQVNYHKNLSEEMYGNCDSLIFTLNTLCWGDFSESNLNATITLNAGCSNPPRVQQDANAQSGHSGGCLECINVDNDNDLDLIDGNLGNDHISFLRNGGTATTAHCDSIDTSYPAYDNPLFMNIFSCAFHLDVDNDGLKDLLFSPNAVNSSENFHSVWYYKNTTSNTDVRVTYMQNNFLQGGMIDVGEGAFPRFFDYDNDGDQDLFIADYGYYNSSGAYPSKIALFKNTGTPAAPVYTLITTDFANIFANNYNITCPVPAFGDVDGDGDADMIVGDNNGKLWYFRKDPGPPDNFVFVGYMNIDVGNYAAPQLVDVDRDGLLDLLVGKQSGTVSYYRNTGTSTAYNFTLVTSAFGNFTVQEPTISTGYSVPYLWDDNGNYVLLVGSERGYLYRFDNIDGNLAGTFNVTDSMYVTTHEGLRIAPWLADINNDSLPDLVIGNYSGGVSLFMGSIPTGISALGINPSDFSVFPNPADNAVTVKIENLEKNNFSLSLFDLSGRMVLQEDEKNISGTFQKQLDLSALNAGVYLVYVQVKGGGTVVRKVVVGR